MNPGRLFLQQASSTPMPVLAALLACCGAAAMPEETYDYIADTILGTGVRPFHAAGRDGSVRGATPDYWYKQSAFKRQHSDLARALLRDARSGGWMLEVGSFIGNSATACAVGSRTGMIALPFLTTHSLWSPVHPHHGSESRPSSWAHAAAAVGSSITLVCLDTWLGDVGMWHRKGKWLGNPDGVTGAPRLFEQFLANIHGKNLSRRVLPLRAPSSVGLRYLSQLISAGKLSPPQIVYIDAAHEYPETELELMGGWALLGAGGYLIGDDFDWFWPSVQQSVSEFVTTVGPTRFEPPAQYAAGWSDVAKKMRVVLTIDEHGNAATTPGRSPLLLKGSQWILRKARASSASIGSATVALGREPIRSLPSASTEPLEPSSPRWPFLRRHQRCCLNGWAAPRYVAC